MPGSALAIRAKADLIVPVGGIGCGPSGLADAGRGPRRSSKHDLCRRLARHSVLGLGMLMPADRNRPRSYPRLTESAAHVPWSDPWSGFD